MGHQIWHKIPVPQFSFPASDRIPGPNFIFYYEALCIVGYGHSMLWFVYTIYTRYESSIFCFICSVNSDSNIYSRYGSADGVHLH